MNLEGVAWEDLEVMLGALEHGSLNKAAVALRVGQSTASRRLARLEHRLGVRLFDRTPEGLLPTVLALELAPHARLIAGHMADIARLANEQEATPRGRVRLAVVDGIAFQWLAPRLPDFYALHPEVELDLLSGQAVVDLMRREADLAVRFVRPTAPDLIVRKLGTVESAAYVRPGVVEDDDLRWVALLDPGEVFQETRWIREQVSPKHLTQVSAWPALFVSVCSGVGAGVLSPIVAEPAGLVRICTHLAPVPSREVYLVYHRALRDVPRIAVFRDWLVQTVEEILATGAGPL